MADTDIQLKAIDAIVHIHTAIKKMQIYPPVNPLITSSIEMLYHHLLEILRQDAPTVFAELEKDLQLRGNLLNVQENESIPVSSLLNIFRCLEVKSISFDKDLQKEEMHFFINLLAKNQKVEQKEEGLGKLSMENRTDDIHSRDKISLTLEKDEEIASILDTDEDQISKNIEAMKKIVNRLSTMDGTIESFFSEEQRELIKKLSGQVVEWLETEKSFTPTYEKVCQNLQILIEGFINFGFFAEAHSIIAVFNKINTGALKKDEEMQEASSEVLRNLASENNINVLFNEININDKNKTTEACQILFGFGDMVMKKLLDSVRDASDSKERIRIIHIIQEMGDKAIPAIKESINISAPWYYLRNMAYILGRIGDEKSSEILRPLLLHKDKRVSMEAFKSIGQIGGNKRGSLLLSVLPNADTELRVNIIEMLGKIKFTDAVTTLLDMLKSKSSMAREEQISLQEKICNALGAIGSPEAIPTLSEIAESKSFLGRSSYTTEVKNAAKRALANIKR